MAVETVRPAAIAAPPKPIHLSPLAMALIPLIVPFLSPEKRSDVCRLRANTLKAIQRGKELARLRDQVRSEAATYRGIIRESLARLGFVYAPTSRYAEEGNRRRRTVHKVQFSHERYNEYAIYFKVLTNHLTLFGGSKDDLPHRVTVSALADPKIEYELSHAVGRRVVVRANDPTKGVWIIVYRSEGGGLLPNSVRYSAILPYYPQDMEKCPLILGVGEHNTIKSIDLDTYPHMLIAGAANSGKSNLLNAILASLIRFTTPDQVQLVLIDPKKVEFVYYAYTPHLAKIVDEKGELPAIIERSGDAVRALRYANRLIDERTELIKQARAKKLSEYNAKHPERALPRLIVVVDELASLWRPGKLKERKIVHALLERIGNMGRAMGVHLLLCTQVPTKENVPTRLKANLWVRISGKLPDVVASQIILGTGDAAWIDDVKGRMVYAIDALRHVIQAPRIGEDEIDQAVGIARGRAEGFLSLDGLDVVPKNDQILRHIGTNGGKLDIPRWGAYFAKRGIPYAHVKGLLQGVKADGWEGASIDRKMDTYWITFDDQPLTVVKPATPKAMIIPMDRWLPAPPPLLMLPAPTTPAAAAKPDPDAPFGDPELAGLMTISQIRKIRGFMQIPDSSIRMAAGRGAIKAIRKYDRWFTTPEAVRAWLDTADAPGKRGRPIKTPKKAKGKGKPPINVGTSEAKAKA